MGVICPSPSYCMKKTAIICHVHEERKEIAVRFGICTLDEFDLKGKTVLCRVDMNQPVDRENDSLKSTARIEACAPTLKEISDAGAKLVVMAHQGSDIEYENF